MKQITYISILLLTLLSSISYSQIQLGNQVVGSTGGYYEGANTSYSYTVGETVIATQSTFSTSFVVTQGFQQVFKFDFIENDSTLKFYSGITANGDGRNDAWIIDNIEYFSENNVKIFNRWGSVVYSVSNYDNDEVVWKGSTGNKYDGKELEAATYFYVATVAGEVYKGWVELTR